MVGMAEPLANESLRKVLHVDCDCFYAAVEMRDAPHLATVPLAIGGRSDRRGVISTCNYRARHFGVRSAMASAHALKLCPDLVLLPGNMEKYKLASRQVMEILQQYAWQFEQVSVDEAYVELTPTTNAVAVAEQIRAQVKAEVGITVSVGVAPNKFLAKVASDWNKPDGVYVIHDADVEHFVAKLPVKKIPGVGPKAVERLARYGIQTCSDIQSMPLKMLIDRFGRFGRALYYRARGEDDRMLVQSRKRKSISVESTFPSDISGQAEVQLAVQALWPRLFKRIQSAQLKPKDLAPFVKVKFHDFQVTTLADTHRLATYDDYAALIQQATQRQPKSIRLIGLGARLRDEDSRQLDLFELGDINGTSDE